MSELNYDLNVTWNPAQLRAGEEVTVTVKVNNATADIAFMSLSVPEHGFYETLKKEGDDTFTLTRIVPYEAPAGTYAVRFYGRDAQGNQGPQVTSSVYVA